MSGAIPAWLRPKALKARYAASKVWKLCMNGIEGDSLVKGNIMKAGDRVTFQIFPSIAMGDINTDTGALANTQIDPTQATITIDKWKGAIVNVVDIADQQAVFNWDEELAEAFGKSMSQQQDTDVLDLASTLTGYTDLGDNASAFTDALVLTAQRTLDDAEVPMEDRNWVICPKAHADLLAEDKFTLANSTGFQKGIQVEKGRVSALYGTPVTVSTRVETESNGRLNVLFHKEAFGIAMQKDFRMERFARTQFATPYAANALYGVAVLRHDHAINVVTAA